VSAAVTEAPAPLRDPCAAGRRKVVLLGPQRHHPTLARVLEEQGLHGEIAVVTAGWQEREDEVEELEQHLGGRTVPLRLHARAQAVFAADPELSDRHRERQETLRRMQRLYDVRLSHAMAALAELEQRAGDDEALALARADALKAVSELDREHLARLRETNERHAPRLALEQRPALAAQRREVAEILRNCETLAIAGGHVAVLLNRLRLFDVAGALQPKQPVVGWSAGAIVLTERVVLYHDSPPQGPGNAEVLEDGLGLARDLVALPHAERRLRLGDRARVSRFARRMAPAACVALDDGGVLVLGMRGRARGHGVRRLETDGTVVPMGEGGE